MDNIIMLFACLAIGMVLRRFNRAPENAHVTINAFIIHVSLPALILLHVQSAHLEHALFYAVLMPWLTFVLSILLFGAIGAALKLPRTTTGALVVVGGLGNTSFIGVPMIEAFYGQDRIPLGIMIDQLGTYLVLSTVGILMICFYADGNTSKREIVRRIVTFPPLIALVLALALKLVDYPHWAVNALDRLGGTLAPLALVSVGLQLRLSDLSAQRGPLAMGLGYKLVLAPLLVMLIYVGVLGLGGTTTQVTLFQSAMPPQIGGAIVAIQYGLNAQLISLMVSIGVLLSFATLPLWWHAFSAI